MMRLEIKKPTESRHHQQIEKWKSILTNELGLEDFKAGPTQYLALEGNAPRGMAMLSPAGGRQQVGYVYVSRRHRYRGIGTRLLDSLEAAARERGAETLLLHVPVRKAKSATLSKRGYEEKGMKGDKLVLMERRLDMEERPGAREQKRKSEQGARQEEPKAPPKPAEPKPVRRPAAKRPEKPAVSKPAGRRPAPEEPRKPARKKTGGRKPAIRPPERGNTPDYRLPEAAEQRIRRLKTVAGTLRSPADAQLLIQEIAALRKAIEEDDPDRLRELLEPKKR